MPKQFDSMPVAAKETEDKKRVELIGIVNINLENDNFAGASFTAEIDGKNRKIEIAKMDDGNFGIRKDIYDNDDWMDDEITREIKNILKEAVDEAKGELATEKYLKNHHYETTKDIEL